jgi:hypothetical protein
MDVWHRFHEQLVISSRGQFVANRIDKPQLQDSFIHQTKYLLGTSKVDQYSLVVITCKKWPDNENDLDNDEYELLI